MYRPPCSLSSVNESVLRSITKASQLVATHKFTNFVLLGDFNLPLLSWSNEGGNFKPTNSRSDKFSNNFIECNSNFLTQAVHQPTFKNNQLDLILTSDPNCIYPVAVKAPLGDSAKNGLHSSLHWNVILNDTYSSIQFQNLRLN